METEMEMETTTRSGLFSSTGVMVLATMAQGSFDPRFGQSWVFVTGATAMLPAMEQTQSLDFDT